MGACRYHSHCMVDLIDTAEYLSQDIVEETERKDRLAGTKGDHLATEFIEEQFEDLGLSPSRQRIEFMGWQPTERPTLELNLGDGEEEVRAVNMSWGGSTSNDGVSGTVEHVGRTPIITGLFYWDKYRVVSDGQTVAHIIGIADPEWQYALPEPLDHATYNFPTVIVGHEDNERLHDAVYEGEVTATLQTDTQYNPQSTTYNIEAEIEGTEDPNDVIIVSAHHDSLPYDRGASDNASGVACMLKLAEHAAEHGHPKTVRFVSFAAEEWNDLGVRHYVRELHESGELSKVVTDFEIDTVGHPEGDTLFFYADDWTRIRLKEKLQNVIEHTEYDEEYDVEYVPTSGGLDSWQFEENDIPTLTNVWWPFPTMHQHHDSGLPIDDEVSSEQMEVTVDIHKHLLNEFEDLTTLHY